MLQVYTSIDSRYSLPEWLPELVQSENYLESSNKALISSDQHSIVWFQQLEDRERAVVKVYHHRKVIDWWRERHSRFRVQREYERLIDFENKSIPCSSPLFWSYGKSSVYGYFELLATREIIGAQQLNSFLLSKDRTKCETGLYRVYETVRRMHDKGLHHGSLHLRNILVVQKHPGCQNVYMVDLPKAIQFPYSITGTRMAYIDLLQLSLGVLNDMDMDICASMLKHYGMNDIAVNRFLNRLRFGRISKVMRNFHRAECQARELLCKTFSTRE